MRIHLKTFLVMAVILSCCWISALSETPTETVLIPDDEWSWTRGAYNTFSGRIDFSEFTDRELSVSISTDLQYNPESEQQSLPVFTSVNGKRIVMTKQSDTILFIPESDSPSMEFTCSFRLPEKQHVNTAAFVLHVTDGNGNELKVLTGRIESTESGTVNRQDPFYFSIDITLVTLILAIAAAMVWTPVLIRNRRRHKTNRTGD